MTDRAQPLSGGGNTIVTPPYDQEIKLASLADIAVRKSPTEAICW